MTEDFDLESYIQAGRAVIAAKKLAKEIINPGALFLEIANSIESEITIYIVIVIQLDFIKIIISWMFLWATAPRASPTIGGRIANIVIAKIIIKKFSKKIGTVNREITAGPTYGINDIVDNPTSSITVTDNIRIIKNEIPIR